ncbi:MAG: hypothetical protein K0U37_06905 [Gammaproteobacteria bacterium]|nr:hypothetical protein [Gammaproteobacteria bacterium]
MEGSNVAYKKAVGALEPLVHDLNEAEQMANQKSKMLLKVLDETHTALSDEQRTITQMLTPKLDRTIHSLEDSGAHFASLKTQFQKNIVHMNAFVDELDALCFQLESEHEVEEASHATSSEKTERLLSHADDAIEQAMLLLKQSPGGVEGEANGVSTATNPAFFRTAPNTPFIPSGSEGRTTLNVTQ